MRGLYNCRGEVWFGCFSFMAYQPCQGEPMANKQCEWQMYIMIILELCKTKMLFKVFSMKYIVKYKGSSLRIEFYIIKNKLPEIVQTTKSVFHILDGVNPVLVNPF